MRILLVEDDPTTQQSIKMMLESEGMVVDTTDLGEDGLEIGKIYEGVVKNTTSFGAFVEIMPGTEGLCHISELEEGRVENTEDVVKRGDTVRVKLISVDEKGRMRLSRRAAMAEAETSGSA